MSKSDTAVDLFMEGYSCSQSVVLAFAEEINADKILLSKLSGSFGGGLGRLRSVCGAVSGMCFVLGALYGYTSPEQAEEKKELYEKIQFLAKEFEKENGSIICSDLLKGQADTSPTPDNRTKEYYQTRPCAELVRHMAGLLEDFIKEHPYS